MKKVITLCLSACLISISCNNDTSRDTKTDSSSTETSTIDTQDNVTEQSATKDGAMLISNSDCIACHQEDKKLIGPSYIEIAQKYTIADKDKLVASIINGSSGSWGDMQMTPHPSLSKNDALIMVEYILTKK